MLRRHDGFSAWTTKDAALSIARRFGLLRRKLPFIAEIELPASAAVEPFHRRPEHVTVYGDPDTFVRSVTEVWAIDSLA